MYRATIAAVVALSAFSAQAQSTNDRARAYCNSNPHISKSYSLLETCIRSEVEAAARLSSRPAPAPIRDYCKSNPYIAPSFSLMETCIQSEMEAKARIGG